MNSYVSLKMILYGHWYTTVILVDTGYMVINTLKLFLPRLHVVEVTSATLETY